MTIRMKIVIGVFMVLLAIISYGCVAIVTYFDPWSPWFYWTVAFSLITTANALWCLHLLGRFGAPIKSVT